MNAPRPLKKNLRVWITRTDASCAASAKAVMSAGYTPLSAPLLTLAPSSTPSGAPPDDHAIAFTSANGVRAFVALTDRRHWPVFAVGAATAAFARARGFKDVECADSDVDGLADLICKRSPNAVTHLSGVHVAGDLVGILTGAGITAKREIIYAARAVTVLPQRAKDALSTPGPIAVMLYSPKGAHIFLKLLPKASLAGLHCVSISAAVDAVLESHDGASDIASRHIAAGPHEPSMIEALECIEQA